MGGARDSYGMTLLNSDILVCGGEPVIYRWTSNCTFYASAVNTWSAFPPLPIAISNFPMITLQDSRPYVFGGWNGRAVFNTVYAFDAINEWTPRTPMPQPLWGHTAVAIDINTAMVCGGLNATALHANSTQSQCCTYAICICGV
jgi:hypothetical protein